AGATCPGPDCFAGGGPAATDCIVEWSGVSASATSCVDGTACDLDGQADGVCTFPLAACLGQAPACPAAGVPQVRVSPAKLPTAGALRGAIESLAPGQCTAPGFAVPVKRRGTLGPIKPGTAKLKVVVTAGSAKDADALRLICQPAAPSFAN